MKSVGISNRLCYSVQVSSGPSVQVSPKSGDKPKDFLSIVKCKIEFLANEVKIYRKEYEKLKEMQGQVIENKEKVEQKVELLKQQLEMVLQQNAKLTIVKKELKEELKELKKDKEILEKQKRKCKKRFKKEMDIILTRNRSINNKYKTQMKASEIKLQEQRYVSLTTKQEMNSLTMKLKTLEESKLKKSDKNFKTKQTIIEDLNNLSHIIEFS